MPSTELWAGALGLLLHHSETGCPSAARQAARLLEHLSNSPEVDAELSALCERASVRLETDGQRKNRAFS